MDPVRVGAWFFLVEAAPTATTVVKVCAARSVSSVTICLRTVTNVLGAVAAAAALPRPRRRAPARRPRTNPTIGRKPFRGRLRTVTDRN